MWKLVNLTFFFFWHLVNIAFFKKALSKNELSETKTAILYHDACLLHLVPKFHRETPQRLLALKEAFLSLTKKYPDNLEMITEFPSSSQKIVALVHDENYLQKLENHALTITDEPQQVFNETDESDMDTYMSKNSMEAALKAVGAVIYAVQLVAFFKKKKQKKRV